MSLAATIPSTPLQSSRPASASTMAGPVVRSASSGQVPTRKSSGSPRQPRNEKQPQSPTSVAKKPQRPRSSSSKMADTNSSQPKQILQPPSKRQQQPREKGPGSPNVRRKEKTGNGQLELQESISINDTTEKSAVSTPRKSQSQPHMSLSNNTPNPQDKQILQPPNKRQQQSREKGSPSVPRKEKQNQSLQVSSDQQQLQLYSRPEKGDGNASRKSQQNNDKANSNGNTRPNSARTGGERTSATSAPVKSAAAAAAAAAFAAAAGAATTRVSTSPNEYSNYSSNQSASNNGNKGGQQQPDSHGKKRRSNSNSNSVANSSGPKPQHRPGLRNKPSTSGKSEVGDNPFAVSPDFTDYTHQQPLDGKPRSANSSATGRQRRLSAPDLRLQPDGMVNGEGVVTCNDGLYAGATFQNSPAANTLPVPVFATRKSVPLNDLLMSGGGGHGAGPASQRQTEHTSTSRFAESSSLPDPGFHYPSVLPLHQSHRPPARTFSHETLATPASRSSAGHAGHGGMINTPSPRRHVTDNEMFAMDDDPYANENSRKGSDEDLRQKSQALFSLLKGARSEQQEQNQQQQQQQHHQYPHHLHQPHGVMQHQFMTENHGGGFPGMGNGHLYMFNNTSTSGHPTHNPNFAPHPGNNPLHIPPHHSHHLSHVPPPFHPHQQHLGGHGHPIPHHPFPPHSAPTSMGMDLTAHAQQNKPQTPMGHPLRNGPGGHHQPPPLPYMDDFNQSQQPQTANRSQAVVPQQQQQPQQSRDQKRQPSTGEDGTASSSRTPSSSTASGSTGMLTQIGNDLKQMLKIH
ncbi:hypothetical protein DFS34DRAFT_48645 [Phlyctochytrium arcticum]|nr:hypothetical protein DFS34DRAFT_48645 [Phlyctochytrium arcticum]